MYRDNSEGVKSIRYGSGTISGDISRAAISVIADRKYAVEWFKMITVTSSDLPGFSNENWDGILGLLPSTLSGSELFVNRLYDKGGIGHNSFGIQLTSTKLGSKITFGGFDTGIVQQKSNFTFNDVSDDKYWALDIYETRYGDGDVLDMDETGKAVIDTGSSFMLFSPKLWGEFKSTISKGKK